MKNIVIVGGGASGAFLAANLNLNAKVHLFEAQGDLLKKVAITGGGRCNFTNVELSRENLDEIFPRGANNIKKILQNFSPKDCIDYFASLGVNSKVENLGRVFPKSDKAQSIINALKNQINKRGNISLHLNNEVLNIEKLDDKYRLNFLDKGNAQNGFIVADIVIFAVGGKWGSSLKKSLQDLSFEFEESLPALFAFKLEKALPHLAGISIKDVKITSSKIPKQKAFCGDILFTHYGLSGPVILKTSSFATKVFHKNNGLDININFVPNFDFDKIIAQTKISSAKKLIKNTPLFGLSQTFWHRYILEKSQISDDLIWANINKAQINNIKNYTQNSKFEIKNKVPNKEEFVSAGGIKLKQINFKNMESKAHKNLFFMGECLDIDAITGGYNLHNAWCCAKTALMYINDM